MNGIKTGFLAIFFQLILLSLCSSAFADKTVTVLYTGCTFGQIYPVNE